MSDSEGFLDRDRALGRERAALAVERRSEGHAVLVGLRAIGEGGDLEAAAVGQPRTGPAGEAVQSAEGFDRLLAGPFVQVVRVREQDLGPGLGELGEAHPAHRAVGRDGHERGRLDDAVGETQSAGARPSVPRLDLEPHAVRAGDPAHPERSSVAAWVSPGAISIASPYE